MLYLILLAIVLSFALGAISLAPFVPTFGKDLERINEVCDLKKGNIFVEIGCGTGRVSYFISKKNPEVSVLGIELNFFLFLFSKVKSIFGPKNLAIKFGNALKYDYSNVDVVYIFGVPKTVSGILKEKLYEELPKKSKYISYVFNVNDWPGEKYFDKRKDNDNKIYVCIK